MKIYFADGKCTIEKEHIKLFVESFKLSVFGNKHNLLPFFATEFKIENGTIVAENEVGIFSAEFTDSQYGIKFSYKFIPKKKVERVESVILNLKLNETVETVLFNEEQYDVCSYNFGTPTNVVKLVDGQDVCATEYAAFRTLSRNYGALGVTTFKRYRSMLLLCKNGLINVYSVINTGANADKYSFDKNKVFQSDNYVLIFDKSDALTKYGKEIAIENGNNNKGRLSGWCSWYYYMSDISEEKILENVAAAKEKKIRFEYIQVDDGWQNKIGDWEANEKFGSGMKCLCDKINRAGFKAGIWVAPFWADEQSDLFIRHSDWFFENNGKKLIDFSKAEPQKWLYELFRKLSYDWGYRYIKIDFVYDRVASFGYENRSWNDLTACRVPFEIIKSAITPDTVILQGSAPLGYLAGLSDSVRIGVDIFENWKSLRHVARFVLRRLYINEYATVDPDCLLLRSANEQDDECGRPCTRNNDELNTFIAFTLVSNGVIFDSDKLSLLSDEKIEIIKTLVSVNFPHFYATDLYDRDVPSIFKAAENGGITYVIINWEDVDKEFRIDLDKPSNVRYVIRNEKVRKNNITLTLKPHSTEIVTVNETENEFKYKSLFLKKENEL